MGPEMEKVAQIVASVLGVDVREVKPESVLREELGADSLDLYQMAMDLEREFDIELDADAMNRIHTVEDALRIIKSTVRK